MAVEGSPGVYKVTAEEGANKDQDTIGNDMDTPYLDVILQASGKLAAGADAGTVTTPSGDVTLSFYIDEIEDYNPDLKYDPTSTDPNHATECLKKFYRDEYATAEKQ